MEIIYKINSINFNVYFPTPLGTLIQGLFFFIKVD